MVLCRRARTFRSFPQPQESQVLDNARGCPAHLAASATSSQMGEFQSEAEAMKALRRQTVEKKFSKVKQSLNKEREHRLADLKVK